jgi:hypothetical protein
MLNAVGPLLSRNYSTCSDCRDNALSGAGQGPFARTSMMARGAGADVGESYRCGYAGRANARKSAGAKTSRGKARTAGNAGRLGLSLSVLADPILSD